MDLRKMEYEVLQGQLKQMDTASAFADAVAGLRLDDSDVATIRREFPILARQVHEKPLVYLDNAATTLKPRTVWQVMEHHYSQESANIHRGIHHLSEQATLKYEDVREKVKNFIKASATEEIIFTKGTTEGINLVAHSYGTFLQKGDEILITTMEHHSNIVPWQLLCQRTGAILKVVPMDDRGDIVWEEFQRLVGPKTKVIGVVYISNSLGTINPVERMIAYARTQAPEVKVLVDAAQTVAHRPIDVQKLDCDFLVFSGHKIFGPTGTGVLYGKKDLLELMPPYQGGGDMISSVTFEKTTFNCLPYKFEAGTPHIGGIIGLGAALDFVQALGFERIQKREKELLDYGTQLLSQIPGLRLIGTAREKSCVLSFVLEGIHPHDIGTFADQEGVALRTGHHCTQPVMDRFKIPATARASLAFYNTKAELEHLKDVLLKIQRIFS